jgi:hypothetical protein
MNNFGPFDKLSKKKKRAFNAERRGTWNGFNPVSRKSKNKKSYDRRRVHKEGSYEICD